jgi:hypothetical protein
MPLADYHYADYHYMVKAFPPNRANHALCVGVCHGERGAITASRMSNRPEHRCGWPLAPGGLR